MMHVKKLKVRRRKGKVQYLRNMGIWCTITFMYCLMHINRKGWLRYKSSHFIILNLVSEP